MRRVAVYITFFLLEAYYNTRIFVFKTLHVVTLKCWSLGIKEVLKRYHNGQTTVKGRTDHCYVYSPTDMETFDW